MLEQLEARDVPAAPVAFDTSATVAANQSVQLAPVATDADNDPLLFSFNSAANGAISPTPDNGPFIYTPNNNFRGIDLLTFQASDGTSSDTGTISMMVDNIAPVATDHQYNTTRGVALTGNVLTNATDADNDTIYAEKYLDPEHGTVDIDADGDFLYIPVAGYTGTDIFQYKAFDNYGGATIKTVSVTVSHGDAIAFRWTGSGAFNNSANWDSIDSDAVTYPAEGDELIFDGNESDADCAIPSGANFSAIRLIDGYEGTVTVSDGLTVGTLELRSGAIFQSDKLEGENVLTVTDEFLWSGGILNSNGDFEGGTNAVVNVVGAEAVFGADDEEVTLYSNSSLRFVADANNVGSEALWLSGIIDLGGNKLFLGEFCGLSDPPGSRVELNGDVEFFGYWRIRGEDKIKGIVEMSGARVTIFATGNLHILKAMVLLQNAIIHANGNIFTGEEVFLRGGSIVNLNGVEFNIGSLGGAIPFRKQITLDTGSKINAIDQSRIIVADQIKLDSSTLDLQNGSIVTCVQIDAINSTISTRINPCAECDTVELNGSLVMKDSSLSLGNYWTTANPDPFQKSILDVTGSIWLDTTAVDMHLNFTPESTESDRITASQQIDLKNTCTFNFHAMLVSTDYEYRNWTPITSKDKIVDNSPQLGTGYLKWLTQTDTFLNVGWGEGSPPV